MVKILHQLGHRYNWNLDCFFNNQIGDGFIFNIYSFPLGKLGGTISTYAPEQYLPISFVDLQYYGYKNSKDKGELGSYEFHPATMEAEGSTVIEYPALIHKGVEYQESLGIKRVIIPMRCEVTKDITKLASVVNNINKHIIENKKTGTEYFLTVSLTDSEVKDAEWIEKLLTLLTKVDKKFDGYYIVCDTAPEYKKKVSLNYDYYNNLSRFFSVLKKNKFQIIHGYANWDAVIFLALADIDYVSVGTFENLRRFNIKRFTEEVGGGPSQGWYYSEKLLNMIRSQELVKLRTNDCIELIKNDKNIFSDIILDPAYPWANNGNNRADVHKNYLLAITRELKAISEVHSGDDRIRYVLKKITDAKSAYKALNDKKAYLTDESGDDHLSVWETFLKSKLS